MANLNLLVVSSLPGAPDANTLYLVQNSGTIYEAYLSDGSSSLLEMGSQPYLEYVLNTKINAANGVAGLNASSEINFANLPFKEEEVGNFIIVNSYADLPIPSKNTIALVVDASDEPSGDYSGATFFGFRLSNEVWYAEQTPSVTIDYKVVILNTEADRLAIVSPDGEKLYVVKNTAKSYFYDGQWVALDVDNLPVHVHSASDITSGTFSTDRYADNSIALNKIQSISGNTLLANVNNGSGNVEEFVIGSNQLVGRYDGINSGRLGAIGLSDLKIALVSDLDATLSIGNTTSQDMFVRTYYTNDGTASRVFMGAKPTGPAAIGGNTIIDHAADVYKPVTSGAGSLIQFDSGDIDFFTMADSSCYASPDIRVSFLVGGEVQIHQFSGANDEVVYADSQGILRLSGYNFEDLNNRYGTHKDANSIAQITASGNDTVLYDFSQGLINIAFENDSVSYGGGDAMIFTWSHLGIENLTDPGGDRIMYWNESNNTTEWLTVGSGITLSGGSLTASALYYSNTSYVQDLSTSAGILTPNGAGTQQQYFYYNAPLYVENVDNDFGGSNIDRAYFYWRHLGIEDLQDPGGDRIMFWDNSENATKWLEIGAGLQITGDVLTATSGGGGGASWITFVGDTGTVTATSAGQTLTVSGGLDISTSIAGSVLTIAYTGGGAGGIASGYANIWADDTNTVSASGSDWVRLKGDGLISTSVSNSEVATGTSGTADEITFSWAHLGIETLSSPGDDRIFFWDQGVATSAWLRVITSNGLQISGTDLKSYSSNTFSDQAGNSMTKTAITNGSYTYQIYGSGLISTAVQTIGSGAAVPRININWTGPNFFLNTVAADSGSWSPSGTTLDTLSVVGGTDISTTIVGDVLTIAFTGGVSGLTSAYARMTDGTNNSDASGSSTFKYRSANGTLSVLVTDNEATHGDNLLLTWAHLGIENLTDPGADRYLMWDDTLGYVVWSTVAGGVSEAFKTFNVSFTTGGTASGGSVVADSATDTYTFIAKNGIDLLNDPTSDGMSIGTIAPWFKNIGLSGNVSGDGTINATYDTGLNLVGGTNVTLVGNNASRTITINAANSYTWTANSGGTSSAIASGTTVNWNAITNSGITTSFDAGTKTFSFSLKNYAAFANTSIPYWDGTNGQFVNSIMTQVASTIQIGGSAYVGGTLMALTSFGVKGNAKDLTFIGSGTQAVNIQTMVPTTVGGDGYIAQINNTVTGGATEIGEWEWVNPKNIGSGPDKYRSASVALIDTNGGSPIYSLSDAQINMGAVGRLAFGNLYIHINTITTGVGNVGIDISAFDANWYRIWDDGNPPQQVMGMGTYITSGGTQKTIMFVKNALDEIELKYLNFTDVPWADIDGGTKIYGTIQYHNN